MGVLAPGSAHAGPSAQPAIGTSGNFPALVSAESISPNLPHFLVKIGLIGGVGGIPQISFSLDSQYFCYLRIIPKIVAYGCFDETVCTAPLGPKKTSWVVYPSETNIQVTPKQKSNFYLTKWCARILLTGESLEFFVMWVPNLYYLADRREFGPKNVLIINYLVRNFGG